MKWLWIGFALVWALSVVLDGRRRARTTTASREHADPEAHPDESLPALLTARGTH